MPPPNRTHDPLRQGLPSGPLYHYASQDGIRGILGEHELWASNIEFLNDVTEFHHGVERIKAAIADRKGQNLAGEKSFFDWLDAIPERVQVEGIYVISLSEERDLLSQWRGYTPSNRGYSIGFDAAGLANLAWEIDGSILVKCVYSEEEKRGLIESLLDPYLAEWREASRPDKDGGEWITPSIADSFSVRAAFAAAAMKDESFREEKEWRIVSANPRTRPVKFRNGSSFLVPYTILKWSPTDPRSAHQPIRSITTGPCPIPPLAMKSIEMMVKSKGIENIEILESTIPYRTW